MEVNKMQVTGKGIKQEIKTGVSHRMMEVNKMQVIGKGIKRDKDRRMTQNDGGQ